jgi:hypothetical protein
MSARDFDVEKFITEDQHIAEYLEVAKQKFDEGNSAIILMAMHECLLLNRPIPEWLRTAFIRAYESAAAFDIKSWDEAFGSPQEENTQLKKRKKHAELRYPIALRVAQRASDEKIQPDLFDKIAEELNIEGVKGATVRKIYYERGGKELHKMIEPLLPWLKRNSASS